MARVRIEFDLDEDYVDAGHPSGITEEANDMITEFVVTMGTNPDVTLISKD